MSRFDQLAQLTEAKSYSDEELLKFMRGQKPGYAMTVAELAYAFGGQSSAHAARLKKLVKLGKLKVLPGKTLGKGSRYGLAEDADLHTKAPVESNSRFDQLAGLTEGPSTGDMVGVMRAYNELDAEAAALSPKVRGKVAMLGKLLKALAGTAEDIATDAQTLTEDANTADTLAEIEMLLSGARYK